MFKFKSKKGAIEMSMNTIIIIVIGVTLLILGLTFVRGIFGKVTTLSEGAFEQAEGKISDFSQITKPLTVTPERITLKKSSSKIVTIVLANLKDKEQKASAVVSSKSATTDLECTFQDTSDKKSDSYTIPSGGFITVKVLVESKSTGNLGNKVCKFEGTGLGDSIVDTLAIVVEA